MAKKIIMVASGGIASLIAWFFIGTVVAGHAFPILGLAAIVFYGFTWGVVGGLLFGVKTSLKIASIGALIGCVLSSFQLASDRAETLGYVHGFVSEWRASLAAILWIIVAVLVFASFAAVVKLLFAPRENQSG